MSGKDRDSNNPPDYYYTLKPKQQANWQRTTRKMEKNEELRRKYPPFQSPTNVNVAHIHRYTPVSIINELITKAEQTKSYTFDTESAKGKNRDHGALMQIQFISPSDHSTIILVETYHLPHRETPLFSQIRKLLGTIFNADNAIISWGPFLEEIKNFTHLELFDPGRVKKKIDLQLYFRRWHNGDKTHPLSERRECRTEGVIDNIFCTSGEDDDEYGEEEFRKSTCQCGHHTHQDPNGKWSLQDAMESALKLFLDKTETVNNWECGLDIALGTWKFSSWNNRTWNMNKEKQIREQMKEYAMNDCFSVEKLFTQMYPTEPHTTNTIDIRKTTPIKCNYYDGISDISEDELVQLLKPKFDKKESMEKQSDDDQQTLTITINPEEIDDFETLEQQHEPLESTTKLSKSERQKKKNQKLKWKQQHRPDFQRKIKRPIYYRYDYRKIRAQLIDDGIHTSHQLTINQRYREVVIGFKSDEEQQRAIEIIKINYFSRDQYYRRWG